MTITPTKTKEKKRKQKKNTQLEVMQNSKVNVKWREYCLILAFIFCVPTCNIMFVALVHGSQCGCHLKG